jgi:hypothetical protein
MNLNTVVKWFILILIFVFDPLAVALILAYNMSISKEYAIYTVDDKKEKPNVVEKPKMEEPKVEKPNVVEEPPKNVVTNTVSEQSITPTEEITQIVEKYDTNNDGKIDEIESTNITKEELKKMDNQGDDFFKRYFTQR